MRTPTTNSVRRLSVGLPHREQGRPCTPPRSSTGQEGEGRHWNRRFDSCGATCSWRSPATIRQARARRRSDARGSLVDTATGWCEEPRWRLDGHLLASVRTGDCSWPVVHGMGIYPCLATTNPVPGEIFHRAMTSFSSTTIPAVVEAHDFSAFGTIADPGGVNGHLLVDVIRANPERPRHSLRLAQRRGGVFIAPRAGWRLRSQSDLDRRLSEPACGCRIPAVVDSADGLDHPCDRSRVGVTGAARNRLPRRCSAADLQGEACVDGMFGFPVEAATLDRDEQATDHRRTRWRTGLETTWIFRPGGFRLR